MSNKLLFSMAVLVTAMMCALAPVPKRPMLATRLRTRRSLFTTTTSAAPARAIPSYCKTSQAIHPCGVCRFFVRPRQNLTARSLITARRPPMDGFTICRIFSLSRV